MITTRFSERRQAGRPVIGFSTQFPDPALLEVVGGDWDFLWIDIQHGVAHLHELPNLIRTCDALGLASFVRTPADVPDMVSYILDLDVAGVIVAQVDRVEQARALVQAAKFPPMGNRSFGGRRIIDRNGRDYMDRANREQMLILQVESPESAAQADALAALPGVDGLMIGPDDMKLRLGLPMGAPFSTPDLLKATRATTRAAGSRGKLAMGFAEPSPAGITAAVESGLNMISLFSIGRVIQAAAADFKKIRQDWGG